MKQNLGIVDRVLRFLLAFWWLGPWALRYNIFLVDWIIVFVAWVAFFESFIGWCGLHYLVRINNKNQ
jgi:hypothetical protein